MGSEIRSGLVSIGTATYRIFYRILAEQFILREHANTKIKGKHIWKKIDHTIGKPFGLRLLVRTESNDPSYFYRKNSEFQAHKGNDFGKINVDAIVNGLEYIGMKLPNEVLGKIAMKLPENRFQYLISSFMEKYKDEIQEEQLRNRNYQYIKEKFGIEDINYDEHDDDDDDDDDVFEDDKKVGSVVKPTVENINFQGALDVVKTFYDHINSQNYYGAWQLMSPDKQMRKPWLGEFDKFSVGYKNTVSVRNVLVLFAHQSSTYIVDCKVFYDDEINLYTSEVLHNFSIMTVKQIGDFTEKVVKLQKGFEDRGFKGFENIPLNKLFDPAASEYIWYTSNVPIDQLDHIFPLRTDVTVRRVVECRCIYVRDSWLINEIRSIKSYSIQ